MLTKIGVAALLGTIGTAVVGGGVAKADEDDYYRQPPLVSVTVAAPPVVTQVAWGHDRDDWRFDRDDWRFDRDDMRPGVYYRQDRREELERARRERREEAMRHASWLHRYGHDFGDRR